MHIAIIADPLDKQRAGIHYLTKYLISNLLEIDKINIFTIIRFKQDSSLVNHQSIVLQNFLPFIKNDPIRTFVTLPLLLQKLKPDIVIEPAHFGPFNLPKKIKRVTIIHDLSPIKFPKFHPFVSQFLQRIFLPGIVRRSNLLVTNSENTSQDLMECYPKSKGKIKKILLGKEDLFMPIFSKEVLQKHDLQTPYFLSVGTIEPRKNLNTLLKAFALFKHTHKSKIQLVIVGGNGWKTDSFYKQFKAHPFKNEIKIIGFADRSDLPTLYSSALALIYPSYYEGFGLPVLEAMACGAPCIVSNSSSLPEVGGDAVLYFNPKDVSELAKQLNFIYTNKAIRSSLNELGIKQASRFSWEKYAQEFIQELENRFVNGSNSNPNTK